MKLKVVIATHPHYNAALDKLLAQLDGPAHAEDIILAFTNVADDSPLPESVQRYKPTYAVVTSPQNNWEYTSFASLGAALTAGSDARVSGGTHFMMMHDTCQAGPQFWQTLDKLSDIVSLRDFRAEPALKDAAGCLSFSIDVQGARWYLRHSKYAVDFAPQEVSELYRHDATWEPKAIAGGLYTLEAHHLGMVMSVKGTLVHRCAPDATYVVAPDACAGSLAAAVLQYLARASWLPLCDSFNMGVAAAGFLQGACQVYTRQTMNKSLAIMIENNHRHPLSLRSLEPHWRYVNAFERFKAVQFPYLLDVYQSGVKRTLKQMPLIDVVKTFVWVDMKKADRDHPSKP
jgi:hypothetical protein